MRRSKYFDKNITILEKENLKNEVKNQQAVIEMLITGDNSRNEWKVVKNDKGKKNTNQNLCLFNTF